MDKITQNELKKIVSYDPKTGIFTNKIKSGKRIIGAISTSYNKKIGYLTIFINGKNHYAHRLAWLYEYGYLPENGIDHINRVKTDNRIDNLREVSQQCNVRNGKIPQHNTSGIKGVGYAKREGLWRARININKKEITLGYHKTKIEAVKARWEAEKKYEFPNCCTSSTAYQYIQDHSEGEDYVRKYQADDSEEFDSPFPVQ